MCYTWVLAADDVDYKTWRENMLHPLQAHEKTHDSVHGGKTKSGRGAVPLNGFTRGFLVKKMVPFWPDVLGCRKG